MISPLIALMIDQVRPLRRRDIPSAIAASGAGGRIELASKRDISVYRLYGETYDVVSHVRMADDDLFEYSLR